MAFEATSEALQHTGQSAVSRWADVIYTYLSAGLVLAILTQVYLAGYGAFRGVQGHQGFEAHETMGNILGVITIVLLVLALVAHVNKATMGGAAVLVLLTEVAQHGLAQAGHSNAWIGGIHAFDGMVILLLATWLATTAWRRQSALRNLNHSRREHS